MYDNAKIEINGHHSHILAGTRKLGKRSKPNWESFANIDATISVEAGFVYIQATFKDPRDVQKLKHKVAEIQGVMAIIIRAEFVS